MTKRFFIKVDKKVAIIDKQENHRIRDMYRACDVLNEQQATITALKEENIELKKLRKYCAEWMGVKEENLYDVVR